MRPRALAYFRVDLTGVELRATDAEFSLGTGNVVELPVKDILLTVTVTVTGRRPDPHEGATAPARPTPGVA
ncbi:hypothetical protein [Streptomyces sp. NPDC050485]|uniref:hypothetical protein n=1 Tax=Streptomyces sp. NPDC050485 TaxID=3365617 RepID=UPI00379B2E64